MILLCVNNLYSVINYTSDHLTLTPNAMMNNTILVLFSLLLFLLRGICTSYRVKRATLRMMGGGVTRGDKFPVLMRILEETQRGLQKGRNAEVLDLCEQIAAQNSEFTKRSTKSPRYLQDYISGKWEMLFTTEKETLFFAKNGLFGSQCTSISQTIDFESNRIVNSIEFENQREFIVVGDISSDESNRQRVNFKFAEAKLILSPSFKIPFPPVGQGWFENVYVNDKYRISKDIRGDYLISRKVRRSFS